MNIPVYEWGKLSSEQKERILRRARTDLSEVKERVRPILEEVHREGDRAVLRYNRQFSSPAGKGGQAPDYDLRVSEKEFRAAEKSLSSELKKALKSAIRRIRLFHREQARELSERPFSLREIGNGLWAGERVLPLDSAGLYVPRGRGSFPSMVYMLAIPAVLAGVRRTVLVSPPDENGALDPACLYAAELCGIREVYKAGGVQGVAALAFGTESLEPADKILGPGSIYVAAAKSLLSEVTDTGPETGPSESVVMADGSGDPCIAALDWMTESEHGGDSQALLVCSSPSWAAQCRDCFSALWADLPEPRKSFVREGIETCGGVILTNSLTESVEAVNALASEHLKILVKEPWKCLPRIRHAGEILIGPHLPFSAANYTAGPNAVLPTGGRARTQSAISVRDFVRFSSVMTASAEGAASLEKTVSVLAEYEGFPAHHRAFSRRKNPPEGLSLKS